MFTGTKKFFRVTASQHRGLALLVAVLLLLVAAVAMKDCRGSGHTPMVRIALPDSLEMHSGTAPWDRDSLFVFDPSSADSAAFVRLGFSPLQARTILHYRESLGGRFRSEEQFSRCYAVSDSMFARLKPYIRLGLPGGKPVKKDYSLLDINRASLARLRVHGALDDALAVKIFRARVRYGGFVDMRQLRSAMPSDSVALLRFAPYAVFDTTALVRYEVNRDSEDLLSGHPYISRRFAREIALRRAQRGPVCCYDSLRSIKYFPRSKADYLYFYLNFDTLENKN